MADLVPADDIERIVGATRHPTMHLARAVSAQQTVYVLHSQECLDTGLDLRECAYSLALDNGIDPAKWRDQEDEAVTVVIDVEHIAGTHHIGRLVPVDGV